MGLWVKIWEMRWGRELDENHELVAGLVGICLDHKVTFVFAARDLERNSAVVLKNYLKPH